MSNSSSVETSASVPAGMSLSMADPHEPSEVETTEASPDELDTSSQSEDGGETEASDGKDQEGSGEAGDDAGVAPEDLGEFDPESVETWDAQYTLEDGSLDFEGALSREFFANAAADKEGLNEGTYAYLEAKGIPKSTVKQVEAMAKTNAEAQKSAVASQDMALFTVAGSPESLQSAIEWGKKGGYNKDAQDRFNRVMGGSDLEAKKEAVELLMARYGSANPTRRPGLPKRDATKGLGARKAGPKPFANREEFREAQRKAKDSPAATKEVARRLKVSKF